MNKIQVREHVGVRKQVEDHVREQFWFHSKGWVAEQVWGHVWERVVGQVWDKVRDE